MKEPFNSAFVLNVDNELRIIKAKLTSLLDREVLPDYANRPDLDYDKTVKNTEPSIKAIWYYFESLSIAVGAKTKETKQ